MQVGEEFKIGKKKFVCTDTWQGQTIKAARIDEPDAATYFFSPEEITKPKKAYGSEYRKMRKLALELARGVCAECGSNENLDVHHLDKNPHNNNIENLKVLCVPCHTKVEGHENYKKAAKYRLLWHIK